VPLKWLLWVDLVTLSKIMMQQDMCVLH
jgi:hypothetical protein